MLRFALVVIDMTNDFVDKNGALYVPGAEKLVPNINELIDNFAHSFNDMVIFANDAHTADDKEFAQFPPHNVVGTPGAKQYPSIKRYSDTIEFGKQAFSVASSESFMELVERRGISVFYLCGVATEYCIRESAMELVKFGTVIVVPDAITGIDEAKASKALDDMCNAKVKLINTSGIVTI